jgi:putative hydrolase of the HAD superfamily
MIRTIFFDFGNVIGFFDHSRAVEKLVKFTNLNGTELALQLYGGPLADDYETGLLTTEEYVREAKLNGRLSCSHDEFLACFTDIFWRNSDVCDLIPKLKPRYRIVLASNTVDAHFRRYVADYADVFTHFNHLVASHHARARKPHIDFFAYAHQFALAERDECLFVDDLPVNIETAMRFGWKGIVYAPDGTLADKLREAGVSFGEPGA